MATSGSKITPCIWCDDQAEQAAAFYARTFPAGRVLATARYPESTDNPIGRARGSVALVDVELAGQRFTLLNGGPAFRPNPSISFFVNVAEPAEADALFSALSAGGEALMPIDRYPWSERYGWIQDRYGVSWQVMAGQSGPIVPCLMFAAGQHGRAEEAMRFYAGIFPDSRIERIERYAEGEGPAGTVKHGRFLLAGQPLVVMDSHVEHETTFNEGVSLFVGCDDQRELDHYWNALAQGGRHDVCGWLEDPFGVSWQIVPSALSRWVTTGDRRSRERVLTAVWGMKKLDIAALERARQDQSSGASATRA